MKAYRKMAFKVVQDLMGIEELPADIGGFQVTLEAAIVWVMREQRLHGCAAPDVVEFQLKLDGRQFSVNVI